VYILLFGLCECRCINCIRLCDSLFYFELNKNSSNDLGAGLPCHGLHTLKKGYLIFSESTETEKEEKLAQNA
jgi:hypothetical protein